MELSSLWTLPFNFQLLKLSALNFVTLITKLTFYYKSSFENVLKQGFSFISSPYLMFSWRPLIRLARNALVLVLILILKLCPMRTQFIYFLMRQKIGNQNTFSVAQRVLLYMLRKYMVGYAWVWVTQKWSRRGRKIKDVQNPKFWGCLPSFRSAASKEVSK